MPKNIVLCCDGTANEFAQNNTNVVKLYSTLIHDPAMQVTYYHPGLGTMEPVGALTTFTRKMTKVLGMAMGYGLSNDIRDAYVFIMQNYEENDRVFMFGFSRGAYTVRAVASLLHLYGLIRRGNESHVPYAIRTLTGMKRDKEKKADGHNDVNSYFSLARGFKGTFSNLCKPWFVGVWDTVSSVGWIENPLKLPHVTNNPDIQIGRHAVAIDERRAFFRQHLWIRPDPPASRDGPKDLKQVWFRGVHCDVGGGYSESESGLSKLAFDWMLQEAKEAKLLVDPAREEEVLGKTESGSYCRPDPNGCMHESLKGWWHLGEYLPKKSYDSKTGKQPRKMNKHKSRELPAKSLIHESVVQRSGGTAGLKLPSDVEVVRTK